ncbi:MAG: hypothetical protein Q8858_09705, partial [Bacteroidota bacterium]|nr:hypothetical protein [Bacteroidota bacterium]
MTLRKRLTATSSSVLVFLSFLLFSNSRILANISSNLADTAKTNGTAAAQLDVYSMPATVHNELTGKNTPNGISSITKLSARVCRGEFEPLSLFLQPKAAVNNITFKWTDFSGSGYSIPQNQLDVSIVKVWYQSGYKSDLTETGVIKHLTQEVLVKNDNIIKVDYSAQTNNLLVSKNGSSYYINISDPNATFPSDVIVKDSSKLQPLSLDGTTNRQIWLTIHVPEDAPSGKYTSQFTISSDQGVIQTFPIEIEVLPFNLDQSRLTYS